MNISFLSLLTLIFITLKLTSIIDLPWFWVVSPILLPLATMIAVAITSATTLGLILIYEFIANYLQKHKAEK